MKARKRRTGRGGLLAVMIACFLGGAAVDWWLRAYGPPLPAGAMERVKAAGAEEREASAGPHARASEPEPVVAAPGAPRPAAAEPAAAIDDLRQRGLRPPIDDMPIAPLKDDFTEVRGGGSRAHEAIDVLAPRHTPIHAVENGIIAKLFLSKAGGNTIYQFDPDERFAYYYAHIERYADGLHEGQKVARGEVIGYVGTSGNAPPDTPHLHFAIFILTPERQWWKGTPLDPYLVFGG